MYQLQLALTAPDRLGDISPGFAPTPASTRRSIGIEALSRCVHDDSLQPAQSVAELLAEAGAQPSDSTGSAWWEKWYRSLGEGARSVVQAEATTWATQLHSALEWRRFEPEALIGRDYRWECNRSPRVTLHAKADVRVAVDGRPVLLLAPTGVPGPYWSAALGLSALMAGSGAWPGVGADTGGRHVAGFGPGQNPLGGARHSRSCLEARGRSGLGHVAAPGCEECSRRINPL